MLASGSSDKTVRLWDVENGRDLRTLRAIRFWLPPSPSRRTARCWPPAATTRPSSSGTWRAGAAAHPRGHSRRCSLRRLLAGRQAAGLGQRDGTARLWNPASGEERISLIAFIDGSSLAVTPEGYFDSSSAKAEEYLNVRVGNRVFGIGSYREKFYRPELVKLKLAGQPLEGFADLGSVKLAPVVELIDLPQTTSDPKLGVNLRITDGGGGIGTVRLLLNGTAVLEDDAPAQGAGPIMRRYTISLVHGHNQIRRSPSTPTAPCRTTRPPAPVEANIRRSRNAACTRSRHPDLQEPRIQPRLLGRGRTAFRRHAAQVFQAPLRQARYPVVDHTRGDRPRSRNLGPQGDASDDSARRPVRVLCGDHGDVANNRFYLATSNIDFFEPDRLEAEALGGKALATLLVNIPAAKKLVIFDTCEAEAMADEMQLVRLNGGLDPKVAATILGRSTGMAVFAAAKTDQAALEGYMDHGVFTYFLAKGLGGGADFAKEGIVNTDGLTFYVRHEVPKLTNSLYHMVDGKKAYYDQHPIAEPSGEEFQVTKVK